MRTLNISGTLPATIVENTAPWEWSGGVALLEDPAIVRFVEVDGFAGNFFDAVFDSRTGFISIRPSARMDAEWFTANGLSTTLNLGLRFFLTDGTQATGSASFTVNLLNIDDTPPEALGFATGGRVRAGVAGAEIGRLAVTDRDTTSGFTFQLAEADAWQFEVVNGILRLRSGISVSMADGPQRSVTVLVSDGQREAAFALSFEVLPADNISQQPVTFMVRGEARQGFSWLNSNYAFGYAPIWEVASIEVAGNHLMLGRKDGRELWMDKPEILDLVSGFVDFRTHGPAAWTWLIWDTVLDRKPRLLEYHATAFHFANGTQPRDYVESFITHGAFGAAMQRLTNREFVAEMYSNIISWDIGADAINWHAGRISQGLVSRTDFVMGLIDWRRGFSDFQTEVAGGFYVPRGYMTQFGALLETLGDYDMGPFVWEWLNLMIEGRLTLREIAQATAVHEPFQRQWAGISDRDFFAITSRDLLGRSISDGDIAWWQWATASGLLTRADFVGILVENMTTQSALHQLPQGPMFDSIW